MRYEGNKVVITESELHNLVNESVKIYLTENAEDETFWGGLKNAAYGFGRGNWNVKQNYKVGNQASTFMKYANSAQNAIGKMMEIAKETQNAPIANSLSGISDSMKTVADGFAAEAKRLAGPQDYTMKVNNDFDKTGGAGMTGMQGGAGMTGMQGGAGMTGMQGGAGMPYGQQTPYGQQMPYGQQTPYGQGYHQWNPEYMKQFYDMFHGLYPQEQQQAATKKPVRKTPTKKPVRKTPAKKRSARTIPEEPAKNIA